MPPVALKLVSLYSLQSANSQAQDGCATDTLLDPAASGEYPANHLPQAYSSVSVAFRAETANSNRGAQVVQLSSPMLSNNNAVDDTRVKITDES